MEDEDSDFEFDKENVKQFDEMNKKFEQMQVGDIKKEDFNQVEEVDPKE